MLAFAQVKGNDRLVNAPKFVKEYLSQRGISLTLAGELGFTFLSADSLIKQAKGPAAEINISAAPDRVAVLMPHHEFLTGEVTWWSARLVTPPSSPEDSKLRVVSFRHETAERSPWGKMFCPPNTPPEVYLPWAPDLPSWALIPKGSRIYLHESAIKAINGARLGFYSIGLNGVWGWASTKHNISLLPTLRDIPWKALDLKPVIVFDTNIDTNPQVELAAQRLAERLLAVTGVTASILRMPHEPEDGDFGFDDFCQRVGDPLATEFLLTEELEDPEISELELGKLELSNRCVIVTSMSRIADLETGTLMTTSGFTELHYAHYQAFVPTQTGGEKRISIAKEWLRDPRRPVVTNIVYAPGKPRIHGGALNTWDGMGLQPQAGDATQWLRLLEMNVKDEDLRNWILDWLAYPLQNPGGKLNSLLLLFGPSGTGKDMFLRPFHRIYGGNAVKVSNDELRSTFTSIYAAKQFIHADELKRLSHQDVINQRVKGIVTNEFMTVNRKGDPEYKIKNVSNLAITSNYFDCIKLDEDDRRAAVVRWEPYNAFMDRRGDPSFWLPLVQWIDDQGSSIIYDYLLRRDLGNFNPGAWAPVTAEKGEVIDSARSPIERFVAQLKTEPEANLPPLTSGRVLFKTRELAVYHYGTEPAKGQVDALGNELRNQGFKLANQGKVIKSLSGVARWWVIPQKEYPAQDWNLPAACTAHLKAHGL